MTTIPEAVRAMQIRTRATSIVVAAFLCAVPWGAHALAVQPTPAVSEGAPEAAAPGPAAASPAGPAARRTTVVTGWTAGTTRLVTTAASRRFTFHLTANGPAGRTVLLQRSVAGAWRTLATTRTSAKRTFRVSFAAPRGASAWRLLLPRTATYAGRATGTKRYVLVRPTPPPTPAPGPTLGNVSVSIAPVVFGTSDGLPAALVAGATYSARIAVLPAERGRLAGMSVSGGGITITACPYQGLPTNVVAVRRCVVSVPATARGPVSVAVIGYGGAGSRLVHTYVHTVAP